jgi:hypothetical protein
MKKAGPQGPAFFIHTFGAALDKAELIDGLALLAELGGAGVDAAA